MTNLIQKNKYIIVFDSDCLICNSFIQYVNKNDTHNLFKYSNFESEYIKNKNLNLDKKSVLLIYSNNILSKSDAIIKILLLVKKHTFLIQFFKLLPLKIRDYFYNIISKNRFLFGKNSNSCSLEIKLKTLT